MPSYRTIPRPCEVCGTEFQARASIIKLGKGRFCSDACRNVGRSKPKPTTKKLPCICERCGKTTMKAPSAIAAGRGRYCGRTCKDAAQENKVTRPCETCGDPVTRKAGAIKARVFCSRKCDLTKNAQPIIMNEDGLTARVPLLERDGTVVNHALIDAADAEWASQWTWNLSKQGQYACRGNGIKMHRELLGLSRNDGVFGDHINLNKLDNRRSNLRATNSSQSPQNVPSRPRSSEYRGVAWLGGKKPWAAYANVGRKRVYYERFTDELEAAEGARAARARFLPFSAD